MCVDISYVTPAGNLALSTTTVSNWFSASAAPVNASSVIVDPLSETLLIDTITVGASFVPWITTVTVPIMTAGLAVLYKS